MTDKITPQGQDIVQPELAEGERVEWYVTGQPISMPSVGTITPTEFGISTPRRDNSEECQSYNNWAAFKHCFLLWGPIKGMFVGDKQVRAEYEQGLYQACGGTRTAITWTVKPEESE